MLLILGKSFGSAKSSVRKMVRFGTEKSRCAYYIYISSYKKTGFFKCKLFYFNNFLSMAYLFFFLKFIDVSVSYFLSKQEA
jgi:hypothetical protein